ncbi:SDR family oxidoreductase [Nocardiopsis dassonvillei]|jgi:NADP-dependent 3-hydroxy acid dehydrogenase YdfG|uniref:SDR family oxidoreductase n=1 Tax=Nocardiopsis dassonvillei TaxID=2014 RepID=UPI00102C8CDE|nr:SDR family oxidoreductase [Nocardiopsis dassonvillei]MCP3012762.1 SDR family oxidoreductase [Nocardiopsis dassonvillei]
MNDQARSMSDQTREAARKVIVVTGASSGIGEAAALRLAAEGHHVVLGARREERLRSLVQQIRDSGGSAEHRGLDVTDPDSVREVLDATVRERGRVDALVNNAGVMPLSRMDALLVQEWHRMVDVNVKGLLHGVAAALPHFQRQGSGHFVTVASIGAHEVVPTSAVYSGTKFAAWAITEGLRLELDPGIRVTTVSPGVVESELADHITDPGAREAMRTYRRNALPADAIARAIAFALDQPADVDVNEIIVRPAAQR